MTLSPLARLLVRRISSLSDPRTRVALLVSLLPSYDPAELAHAQSEIARSAGLHDTPAQCTLLALAEAEAMLAPPDDEDEGAARSEAVNWGTARPLTLGERKSLARRPERLLLDRALRDPHPDVIRELLLNPRLTEDDVVRVCAMRHAPPAVLVRVFTSPRWALLPRVRFALVSNRRCPRSVALALVPLLGTTALRELAADTRLAAQVRALALEVLSRLPPTPAPLDVLQ